MADRVIFHIDCNAFYASVEETLHPELKTVPMAVCGNPENRHGIILAKNELAKQYRVKTAETIWQAKQKCPNLVLAPARHSLYQAYSERVNALYEDYTDQVERFGIDESYLDVTGSLHLFEGDMLQLAHRIRQRVNEETALTVSVGISYNKSFAKVASDMRKPNAVSVISRENYQDVLWPMPVAVLMMVGKSTEDHLHALGIQTVEDLAKTDGKILQTALGKLGFQLKEIACGNDHSPVLHVGEGSEARSVGNGLTFKRDLLSQRDIKTAVFALSDTLAARLRRHGVKCATIQVTIKDTKLKAITRQSPLKRPTWLARDIAKGAITILQSAWRLGEPIRMLTLTGLHLQDPDESVEQVSFLDDKKQESGAERQESLERAMDWIREKHGAESLALGNVLGNDLGLYEGKNAKEGMKK